MGPVPSRRFRVVYGRATSGKRQEGSTCSASAGRHSCMRALRRSRIFLTFDSARTVRRLYVLMQAGRYAGPENATMPTASEAMNPALTPVERRLELGHSLLILMDQQIAESTRRITLSRELLEKPVYKGP